MSDLMLNLIGFDSHKTTKGQGPKRKQGNEKHQRFIKHRKFLQCRAVIKLPTPGSHQKKQPVKHPQTSKPALSHARPQPSRPSPTSQSSTHTKGGTKSTKITSTSTRSGSRSTRSGSKSTRRGRKNPKRVPKRKKSKKNVSGSATHTHGAGGAVGAVGLMPSYKFVAMDCEMVGTGSRGCQSELARCSIVSYSGDVIYDKYIKPTNRVTDYRTRWSGIRSHHLINATPFVQAKKEIMKILAGKVVVGHAIYNDFKCLHYIHPPHLTRDTAHIPLLNTRAGYPENQAVSLKALTKTLLRKNIQVGRKGHSSVEDAKAAMELYKIVEEDWERTLAS